MWFTFALFSVTSLIIFGLAFTKNPSARFYHYVSFSVCAIAALAYLCMAIGLGVEHVNGRDVFIWRFADWALTTPLLLVDLGTFAKLSASNIFALVMVDELMIAAGLFASLTTGAGSWGLFAFGVISFLPILFFLNEDFDMIRTVENVGEVAAKNYQCLGYYLASLWTLYPVVWVLAAVDVISVDWECILYGILDILAKAVFCTWLLGTKPEDFSADAEKDLELEIEMERHAQHEMKMKG